MTNNNQQKVYDRIDELFHRIFELKDSSEFANFLRFLKRVPSHAPFNNALIFAQNPECFYYATAKQWEKQFKRTIKDHSRPLVILFPFGPVEFVYDFADTEGQPVTKEELLYWWKETEGRFSNLIVKRTIKNCVRLGIHFDNSTKEKYLLDDRFRTWGYASVDKHNAREIVFHPRYNNEAFMQEAYGVLCHEIAHHLLGHLGEIRLESQDGKSTKKIAPNRKHIEKNIKELEAELTAWIVFDLWGIEKRSAEYMASWLFNQKDKEEINMGLVLKVSGKIKEIGLK